MALDATAREANLRDSVKKYLKDSCSASNIPVLFDVRLTDPDLSDKSVNRWVSVIIGPVVPGDVTTVTLDIYCVTRGDPEGFRLSQLRDTMMGYLTDNTSTDGARRITFYQSVHGGDWVNIGGILVTSIAESGENIARDMTRFKIISCVLRFASKF